MDQDTLDKLASGEYSISPRSGRLRKRIRVKEDSGRFKKSGMRKTINMLLWIVLIGGFILSLVYVIPELNIVSEKKSMLRAK